MLHNKQTSIKTEVLGGLSTFATMVYVIVVNPTILSAAGLDFAAVMVATIIATACATFLMGISANAPFAVAPGMGVSAYFAYSVVLEQQIPWQGALAIVFASAFCLFLFTLIRLRAWIIHQIPPILAEGITAGVGLFLVFVGLRAIGLIEHVGTFISFGSIFNIPVGLALFGLLLIYFLLKKQVRSAFIIAIGANWALALIFGITQWQGFVSLPPSLSPTLNQLDFSILQTLDAYRVLLAIFLVTLFDSTCALTALAQRASLVNKQGKIKSVQKMLFPDTVFSMVGAFLGTASLAIHLESLSGIQAGARRGLSSIVVASCFVLCLFFYPLIASIPHFATAPVLVAIGLMMAAPLKKVRVKEPFNGAILLITALIMPITMSIYYGFVFGFWAYTLLHILRGKIKEISGLCWALSLLFLLQIGIELFK